MSPRRKSLATLQARSDDIDARELDRLLGDQRAGVRAFARAEIRRRNKRSAEEARLAAMLAEERLWWLRGVEKIAGVDEAGAGPLAGPVVAAAVILSPGTSLAGIDDSKKLSPAKRQQLAAAIRERALAYAIGISSHDEIDAINILQAARLAMRRAVDGLVPRPQHLLVDARQVPHVDMPQTSLIRGDSRSQSIAAAGILAKVYRDALMEEMAERFPGYGFEKHKGYGTRVHLNALRHLGPCSIHRRSFAPVARVCGRSPGGQRN